MPALNNNTQYCHLVDRNDSDNLIVPGTLTVGGEAVGAGGSGEGFTDVGSDTYIFSPTDGAAIVIDVDSTGSLILRNDTCTLNMTANDVDLTATAEAGQINLVAEGDSSAIAISCSGATSQLALNATAVYIGAATDTLSFHDATPTAKQTGVAVTAEAIHAALVNLGLIAA